jgi:hypothetical protein
VRRDRGARWLGFAGGQEVEDPGLRQAGQAGRRCW